MKIGLLDLNMLVALAWPSHIHHRHAREWFSKYSASGWATCPITQNGFVRLSSNPSIVDEAVSPAEAISLLKEMTSHRDHVFWPDSIELTGAKDVPSSMIVGHRQVTDAYLISLAVSNDGVLVTFDRGVLSLIPSGSDIHDHVKVVSVN